MLVAEGLLHALHVGEVALQLVAPLVTSPLARALLVQLSRRAPQRVATCAAAALPPQCRVCRLQPHAVD